ncbi:hypothetical protein C0995_015269 [Termitomyces sp. Mi166|nr:hypothetical protein C0995_015269 [Termitomyces sp. Mi166\
MTSTLFVLSLIFIIFLRQFTHAQPILTFNSQTILWPDSRKDLELIPSFIKDRQGELALQIPLRTRPTTVFRPRSLEALHHARLRSLRNRESEVVEWEELTIFGPDVEDRRTLSQLARMAGNAYALPGQRNWYEVAWNMSLPFGWEDEADGFRGHVFFSSDNSTIVLAIKVVSKQLVDDLRLKYPSSNIWLVGHSLGGALASLLGSTYGFPAVAFESPGERLAAHRLHLPLPHLQNSTVPPVAVTHVYHSGDPIPQGTCTGFGSPCAQAGFALETRCHLGKSIVFDTVGKLGWRVDVRKHVIRDVIKKVLEIDGIEWEEGRDVPLARSEEDCVVNEEFDYTQRHMPLVTPIYVNKLDLGGTLAKDFSLRDGNVTVQVPFISSTIENPDEKHQIILFGDSGNESDNFTIKFDPEVFTTTQDKWD